MTADNPQVLEYQRYVQPTILGTCEIDLASLIFEKHTSAVTIPLETKLDDNAFISFSAKVTNLVLGSDTVVSSSMSSVSERLGGYEGTALHVLYPISCRLNSGHFHRY